MLIPLYSTCEETEARELSGLVSATHLVSVSVVGAAGLFTKYPHHSVTESAPLTEPLHRPPPPSLPPHPLHRTPPYPPRHFLALELGEWWCFSGFLTDWFPI